MIDDETLGRMCCLRDMSSGPVGQLFRAALKCRSALDNGRLLAEISVICEALVGHCDVDHFLAESVYRKLLVGRIEEAARKQAQDAMDSLLTLEAEGKGSDAPSAKVRDELAGSAWRHLHK